MRRAGLVGVPRVRPWSWQAFLLGFVVVAVSAALQGVCVALGAKLYFAAFLPSLFVLGIVGWIPAGGEALALRGPWFAIAVACNFVLGALMTLGVGLYAP